MPSALEASGQRNRGCRRTQFAAERRLSPFSRARHLADFLHDEVALDASDPIEKQLTVEVIHLVLKGTSEEIRALDRTHCSAAVETPHDRPHWPGDCGIEAGNRSEERRVGKESS